MRDSKRMPPAFSAMLIKPMNSERMPISLRQISTAVQQVSITPSMGFCLRPRIYDAVTIRDAANFDWMRAAESCREASARMYLVSLSASFCST